MTLQTFVDAFAATLWHPELSLLPSLATLIGFVAIVLYEKVVESTVRFLFCIAFGVIAYCAALYIGLTGLIVAFGGGSLYGKEVGLAFLLGIVPQLTAGLAFGIWIEKFVDRLAHEKELDQVLQPA